MTPKQLQAVVKEMEYRKRILQEMLSRTSTALDTLRNTEPDFRKWLEDLNGRFFANQDGESGKPDVAEPARVDEGTNCVRVGQDGTLPTDPD